MAPIGKKAGKQSVKKKSTKSSKNDDVKTKVKKSTAHQQKEASPTPSTNTTAKEVVNDIPSGEFLKVDDIGADGAAGLADDGYTALEALHQELDNGEYSVDEGDASSSDEETPTADVPKLDKKAQQKVQKAIKDSRKARKGKPIGDEAERGVVYLGHVPHGFYEEQMMAYFSQFGLVTRLRLSRNPKTGKSRHYAFIEFKHAEVAKIVAETMDGYIMFARILKCAVVSKEKQHKKMWSGAYTGRGEPRVVKNRKREEMTPDILELKIHNLVANEEKLREQLSKADIEYEFVGFKQLKEESDKQKVASLQ